MTEINASVEAAAINLLADDIGEWAKLKGFRKDWTMAAWLREFAEDFGATDWDAVDTSQFSEVQDRLKEISYRLEELANVSKLMLMVSEVSEALEGMRDGKEYGEELADLVIRVFENAHVNRVPIGDAIVAKMAKNNGRPYLHGRQF